MKCICSLFSCFVCFLINQAVFVVSEVAKATMPWESAKSKIEIAPIHVSCDINDIIVISAPAVNNEALYYLNKPNGGSIKIDFTRPKPKLAKQNSTQRVDKYDWHEYDKIIVKYVNKDVKTIYPKNNYKVINANFGLLPAVSNNIVEDTENEMLEKDFMLGPVSGEDHGNWVLSVYCKDLDEEWIEMFQVITIHVVENVPMTPWLPRLEEGSTFNLSFAYPIKDLVTCELTAPRSTFDRYFDRYRIELDTCGFVVPNVTKADTGMWKVIGVGKIVYEGFVVLTVDNKVT